MTPPPHDDLRPTRFIASLLHRQNRLQHFTTHGRSNDFDRAELAALRWAIPHLQAMFPPTPRPESDPPHDVPSP
jgi:hypothetical protein